MSGKASSSKEVLVTSAAKCDESSSFVDQHLADSEIMTKRLKLYRAALNGDWQVAKSIYDVHREDIGNEISKIGYTALHIAAMSGSIDFVKELVKMLDDKDIICQTNSGGITALSFAAASGNVEIARELVNKNKEVAMIRDEHGDLPVEMAASLGHREMVKYLYEETNDKLDENDLIQLLVTSIKTELYDVALHLVQAHTELATARSKNDETALHALALKQLPSSNEKLGFLGRCFNLGAKNVENGRYPAVELVELLWKEVLSLGEPKISNLIAFPSKLIFTAAEKGHDWFLSIFIREYPDLIWKFNNGDDFYSIFHTAVLYRQENIFKFIHEIGSAKDLLLLTKDNDGNNILHLAAKLAPTDRLNIVSGPALQMQRELLWFKEVRKIVKPSLLQAKNNYGLTPWELFVKEHEELRETGEKWLKESAQACMVVAALIATVAFAAAITVPGGNKGDTGFPFFLQKASFQIFAISDALSLGCSSISMVAFLSIFTSRHAQEDFLRRSPTKLNVGLVTLFMSIAAMMIMFCATFFILFRDRKLWIAILITVISSVPVFLFISQHFRLFCDVLHTTTGSASLFKRGKNKLFRKEGETAEFKEVKDYNARLPIRFPCSTNV